MRRFLLPFMVLLSACEPPPPLPTGVDTRSIVGGTPTPDSVLPAVGALVVEQYTIKQTLCSATLISDRLLLTAAHCVNDWLSYKAQAPNLTLGFFNGSTLTASSPLLAIASVQAHPDYVAGNPPPGGLSVYNDIGIARLAQATAIPPMKLIRPSEVSAIKIGASVEIAGYGLTDPYNQLTSGNKNNGTTVIGDVGTAEIYILGDSRPQKCSGDSGGPTILEVDGASGKQQRLIGVASRGGDKCVGGSIETRVDFFLSWISSFGTLPCGSGPSPDCAPPPPLNSFGDPCSSSDECTDKLCVHSAGTMICSKPCVVGSDTCPTGTQCTAAAGSDQGACLKPPAPAAKKKAGESCSSDTECESKVCLAGASGGSTCATACDQSKAGCGSGQECVSSSGGDHYCATIGNPPAAPPKSGGCSMTGRSAPGAPGPALLLLPALLALLWRRRP